MRRKGLKSKVAQALIVTMLVSSTSISSLADVADAVAEEIKLTGYLGTDYKLVTLHTDIGEFLSPMEFKEDEKAPVATDSNATPSDASPSNSKAASVSAEDDEELDDVDLLNDLGKTGSLIEGTDNRVTTFAVEGDYLTEDMLKEVIGKPGEGNVNLFYGNWDEDPEDPKKAEILWCAKDKDPESEVNLYGEDGEGLLLTEDETILYAYSYIRAAVNGNQLVLDGDRPKDLCKISTRGLPDDVRLRVSDLAEEDRKTPEQLLQALEDASSAGTIYEDLDAESALQLNIRTDDRDYEGRAEIRMELPKSFVGKAVEEEKDFVVIHFIDWKQPEIIEPEIIYLDEGDSRAEIEFTLNSFSPVIIALAKTTSMAEVTLEAVENGYGIVYSQTEDADGKTTRTYLPAGEAVQIPENTELRMEDTIIEGESKSYSVGSYHVKVDSNEPETVPWYEVYTVPGGAKKIVITPVVTEDTYTSDNKEEIRIGYRLDGEQWTGGKKEGGKFVLRNRTQEGSTVLEAKNWEFGDVFSLNEGQIREWQREHIAHDLFVLNEDGTFISKDVVQPGIYCFYVTCEYDGESYGRVMEIDAGIMVDFSVRLGHYTSGASGERYVASHWLADSEYYPVGSTFGTIREETKELWENRQFPDEIAMYGYDFAGWYKGNLKEELTNDTKLDEYTDAYACFKKSETNEFYDPAIKVDGVGDPDDPDNPNNPSRPNRPGSSGGSGSSGGGGGSSSSGSRAADTIFGSWQQDERGWRFQLSNGSYAVNQWGRLKGVWYYFGADTYMLTGWLNLDGVWYYLNPAAGDQAGQMKTGWIFDQTYNAWFYLNPAQGSQEGRMLTGWQNINNVWYYLNPVADGTGGAMLADQWIGEYYVNADGAWVEGMTR